MNWDRVEGNWKQLTGKVKDEAGELGDQFFQAVAVEADGEFSVLTIAFLANHGTPPILGMDDNGAGLQPGGFDGRSGGGCGRRLRE